MLSIYILYINYLFCINSAIFNVSNNYIVILYKQLVYHT